MTLIDGDAGTHQPNAALDFEPSSLLHGGSSPTLRLRARLRSLSAFFRIALITGEPGSGKRRAARELHRQSHADGPFLLYKPGESRSPAPGFASHPGPYRMDSVWPELCASAHGGTLVIEELGDLSAADQASLLRCLYEPSWRTAPLARTQIIGISREPSRVLRSSGRLRQELCNQFSAVEIRVQPLRDRLDDVEELASELLAETAAELRVAVPQISPDALASLRDRPWPGNVAELRSVLREALQCDRRPVLDLQSFCVASTESGPSAKAQASLRLQDAVDEHVVRVLAVCGGNKLKTAELLGVSRSTLYRMLEAMPVLPK